MANTLLVIDDLTSVLTLKNKWVRAFVGLYVWHIGRCVKFCVQRIKRQHEQDKLYVAGPREILSDLKISNCTMLFYDRHIDEINWEKAGLIASELAQKWQSNESLKTLCPFLFEGSVSVPKITYVRLAHLFCSTRYWPFPLWLLARF